MTLKKMLTILLCLSMIICSTLPILANNHNSLNSKIVLLSRASGGSSGGGGGSSYGGSSGGGGGSSSSGSSGGGGGSSYGSRSGGGSNDDGRSYTSIYDSDGNIVGRYDLSAEDSWVSGDGSYGGGAVQTYQRNNNSSDGNRSASASGGNGTDDGTWVQNPSTNKWYFYESAKTPSESKRSTGWKEISGSWYYFGSDGAMYQNTVTPDGYYVDNNGAWVKQ